MSMQPINILVIGDIILDEDIRGEVNRVSPEAPISVLENAKITYSLGGAAKVAETLDQNTEEVLTDLLGIIGDDKGKKEIESIITHKTCITFHKIVDFNNPTTIKTRFYSANVPLLRYDVETKEHTRMENSLIDSVQRLIDTKLFHGVILSDYEKGVFNSRTIPVILEILKKKDIPVFVDPKKDNIPYYLNCEIIKINERELNDFIPDKSLDLKQKVRKLSDTLKCEWLIVTRGVDNTYVASKKILIDITVPKTYLNNTYINCVGAGDLFMAKLVERYVSGKDIVEAINPAAWFVKSYLEKYHNANV